MPEQPQERKNDEKQNWGTSKYITKYITMTLSIPPRS